MIFVLLPAYNEENSIPRLLPKIDSVMKACGGSYKLLIGDDGSRDRTLEVLRELSQTYPIEIIRHAINRGLGETSRDLFERAAALAVDEDIIIRMDCDDTHEPEAVHRMLERIAAGYDVVIASRFQPGGGQHGVTGYRATISRLANLFMTLFFPIPGVREFSCGFRAYRASVIRKAIQFYGNDFIQLKGLGFTCTLEKLVKLHLLGARVTEVPFVLRYDQKASSSKMVFSVTTLGYFVMAILYHWPWGGWRPSVRRALAATAPRDDKNHLGALAECLPEREPAKQSSG